MPSSSLVLPQRCFSPLVGARFSLLCLLPRSTRSLLLFKPSKAPISGCHRQLLHGLRRTTQCALVGSPQNLEHRIRQEIRADHFVGVQTTIRSEEREKDLMKIEIELLKNEEELRRRDEEIVKYKLGIHNDQLDIQRQQAKIRRERTLLKISWIIFILISLYCICKQ
ncbi:uncharacterized protein LOC121260060 [Juglans microcarpa x Juglans regia]|uniref:uncharacterized protein LOC121260060 n=1 Tax=Juglans microcarpa x Juglans regia TaxID=2249226 RepID=UPI001B7ECB78|nr:uncharacterized protein LOC121260060 [Juglans microcarpa x Juglans regia]